VAVLERLEETDRGRMERENFFKEKKRKNVYILCVKKTNFLAYKS